MESVAGNLYDYPAYYDLVFGSDWKAELDFLQDCFEKHGGRVRRLFEPACGTGRLLYRLAEAGYQVSGLDLNDKAVDYCNRRLQRHGLARTALVGDMCDFRLARPVDAAFNMINSFRHLTTHRQAVAHLRCMAEAVKPGGLYLLGLHLTPTEGEPMEEESWSARRGHLCVNTHLQTIDRDTRRRLERFRMHYDVYTPSRQFRISDEISFRTYTASQFARLLREVGSWQVLETYDFRYDIDQPIQVQPDTEDVVYVLRNS